MSEDISLTLPPLVVGITQYAQLYVEQFLEFQAVACPLTVFCTLGIVYLAHRLVMAHQMQALGDEGWQGLGQWSRQLLEHRLHQFL